MDEFHMLNMCMMGESYLKLSSKSRHIPRLRSPCEPSNGNPDICSSYLSIPTCGQLIQCIVDENILSLKRGREEHCLLRF